MKESFKVIEGHSNYKVSNMGRVLNVKSGKFLHPYCNGKGYLYVRLNEKQYRLHVLVATAFLPKTQGKNVVNHKHGVKTDCRASQLEWCSQSENVKHAWDTGLRKRQVPHVSKVNSASPSAPDAM